MFAVAYLAWMLWRNGQHVHAWSWVTLALAMVLMSRVHPRSPVFVASLAVVVTSLAIATDSLLIGAAGLFLVAAAAQNLVGRVRVHLDTDLITPLPPGSAMPGADAFIRAFESEGWTHEGALSAPIKGLDVISTLMLSPDLRSFAEVTDVVIVVISDFEGGRSLVSRNSPVTNMPPAYLTNDLRGAPVHELVVAHDRALHILSAMGMHAFRLEGTHIPDRAIAGEQTVVDWHRRNPTRMSSSRGTGPLDDSRRSAERIEAWRSAV